jgi:hypothetical protein
MRRSRNAALAVVFIAIIALTVSVQFSGKRTPNHQPTLTNIQRGSIDQLQRDFNTASDRVRVILLLSPT